MAIRKRTKFYLGLIISAGAIIFLAILLFQGPHTRIPEHTVEIMHDNPKGPGFTDIESNDELELNYEATEGVNVLLMKKDDAGNYFNNPVPTVKPIVLASESTTGTIHHTFDSGGEWNIYFENPYPPSKEHPPATVKYWGMLKKKSDDLTFFYLNIIVCVILIVLGLLLLNSSRTPKGKPSVQKKKGNKKMLLK
jgi:hypothetical protein